MPGIWNVTVIFSRRLDQDRTLEILAGKGGIGADIGPGFQTQKGLGASSNAPAGTLVAGEPECDKVFFLDQCRRAEVAGPGQ